MSKRITLKSGLSFEKLITVGLTEIIEGREIWTCYCECGQYTLVQAKSLTGKNSRSCGCLKTLLCRTEKVQKMWKSQTPKEDLSGRKFGKVTVTSFSHKNKSHSYFWNCLCDCGNKTIKTRTSLLYRNCSCGCTNKTLLQDFTGKQLGLITVINKAPSRIIFRKNTKKQFSETIWNCLCGCGRKIQLPMMVVKRGTKTHCGCLTTPSKKHKRSINPLNYKWVKTVYLRDSYTCQITLKTKSPQFKIDAHHLFNYNNYPDLRYEINNGITISSVLHRLFHVLYGNKNNTSEQFEEFKQRYLSQNLNSLLPEELQKK